MFKVIGVTAVLAALVYLGIMFGMPQFRYHAYKSDSKDIINYHISRADELRAKFLERGLERGIPMSADNIYIERYEKGFGATIQWSETVNIFDQYKKRYDFSISVGEGSRQ